MGIGYKDPGEGLKDYQYYTGSTPIVEDEPTKVEDSIVHTVGTLENPLPISLSNYSHVLIRQLADASLAKVRRWLMKGVRPLATEASGLDATTRCYYNKFRRLKISEENLITIKYCGESS